jgi:hypothetical protein
MTRARQLHYNAQYVERISQREPGELTSKEFQYDRLKPLRKGIERHSTAILIH